jgi:hypothetical protein
MFIGDVSSGASVAFSITCSVAKANAGTYPLKVVINYEDDTNTWGSKVVELNVRVVEGAAQTSRTGEQTGPGLSIVSILVIGLVGLGAGVALTIILYRRRLLKVPEISKKGA